MCVCVFAQIKLNNERLNDRNIISFDAKHTRKKLLHFIFFCMNETFCLFLLEINNNQRTQRIKRIGTDEGA